MAALDEAISRQFREWEMRGRSGRIFQYPVALEPPFVPFTGYYLPKQRVDDGRRETGLSRFWNRISAPASEVVTEELEVPEPEPEFRDAELGVELQLSLPLSRSVPTPQVETFIRHIARAGEPLALEILGTERETVPQFIASPHAATRVRSAIEACFPGIVCTPVGDSDATGEALSQAWHDSESRFAVVELGLGREFMLPLGNPRCDLLATVVAAMDVLENRELALFQILFEPVQAPWAESMARAVTGSGASRSSTTAQTSCAGWSRKMRRRFSV